MEDKINRKKKRLLFSSENKPKRHRRCLRDRIFSDDDLLLEILTRVSDCKSIFRCTAVCKRWFSLINSHYYKQKMLERRHQPKSRPPLPCTLLFRYGDYGGNATIPLYEYLSKESQISHGRLVTDYLSFLKKPVRIHSSFDDLLLVSRDQNDEPIFTICNPLTRRWLDLPRLPQGILFPWAGLVFDPYRSTYKVMVIWESGHSVDDHDMIESTVITFCSAIGKWTNSTISLPYQRFFNENPPVACNGILHWLVGPREIDTVDGILAVDPIKLTNHDPNYHRFISFPNGLLQGTQRRPYTHDVYLRMGSVQGRLRLSQLIINKKHGLILKVWELNYDDNKANGDNNDAAPNDDDDDDGGGSSRTSWTLVHDVRVKSWIGKRLFVTAFHPDNGNVLFLLFNSRHIYEYNIQEEVMKKIAQLPNDGDGTFPASLRIYTLVHPLWPTPIQAHP